MSAKQAIGDVIANPLSGKIGSLIWKLTVALLLALIYFEGKNMANGFIAQNPDMVANKSAIAAAQLAVIDARTTALAAATDAKTTAIDAATKVQEVAASETRIFDALRQDHADQQAVVVSIATLTEHVAGLEKQVDRVETKQDATAK
jgi:hypothetical protein